MIEFRLRTKIPDSELQQKVGKVLTVDDFNVVLSGAATVRKPDGRLLCIYLPGALVDAVDEAYPTLTKIRQGSYNRGLASGSLQQRTGPAGTINTARPVMSAILGAVDPTPRLPTCRLTAFTAKETMAWDNLQPLWRQIARLFEQHVPDRYANQARQAAQTHDEWVIAGTPFTTVTVNNSYSTGVHTDKGDLDAGFSCLGVLRKGSYTGGHLTFPEYRVAVELQHGDLLLMDAHEWHGNTKMVCECGDALFEKPCDRCGAERISVVCYYRTRMAQCGTAAQEARKRLLAVEAKHSKTLGLDAPPEGATEPVEASSASPAGEA